MSHLKFSRPFFKNGYRAYSLFLAGLLLLSISLIALYPLLSTGDNTVRAQPVLLELASKQPETRVNVIVQKQGGGTEAEGLVTGLGGNVTGDLHIINGFTAQLPAQAVPQLARASSVRWVSLDAVMVSNYTTSPTSADGLPQNTYNQTISADKVWSRFKGEGIGVAVVDSGINPAEDFYDKTNWQSRLKQSIAFNSGWNQTVYDRYGHGTHIAGVVAGSGRQSYDDPYVGVAPRANLINVKVSDDDGSSNASNVVKGLQWIYDNRQLYNIRVVNISLNSSVAESYHVNPLCAAAEMLWFNGIVVVVSAGNSGNNTLLPPANDPFVITVGATDEKGTLDLADDTIAKFSAFGKTLDGFSKPDLVAPGKDIISVSAAANSNLAQQHASNIVNPDYFRMSGTSVAAPMVSGAAALLIQSNPGLTPDQVKFRLMNTARPFFNTNQAGAGILNVQAAVNSTTIQRANLNLFPSRLLNLSGNSSDTGSTASWSTASWSTASWSTASWSTASWSSTYWGSDN